MCPTDSGNAEENIDIALPKTIAQPQNKTSTAMDENDPNCPGSIAALRAEGLDEGGLPFHLPMGINNTGSGPCSPESSDYSHDECWCEDGGNCLIVPPTIFVNDN